MYDFPVFLSLSDMPVVIIGGGKIAFRKAVKLEPSGADITVVAPEFHADFEQWAPGKKITMIKDKARPEHISGAFLIISASGSREAINMLKAHHSPNQLINGADDKTFGNTAFPAVLKEKEFHIAVSTGGRSPRLAKAIKNHLHSIKNQLRHL